MVYIKQEDGTQKKFACLSCIKGHRSSKCEHVDRELIEIKRKGRPVTQCERCRQLRKTKQMHLKCECRLKQKTLRSIESRDSNLCLECKKLKGFCICYKGDIGKINTKNCISRSSSTSSRSSSSSSHSPCSEGSLTPPIHQQLYPAGLIDDNNNNNNNNKRSHHLIIPIHDPSDDIDSDTPKYKSEEHAIPDKTAVLGELTNTSSEELMNKIYSAFNDKHKINQEEEDQLAELSNE
ncbi:Putative Copper fist transcription factor [Rhizopus microsporus]|nr:Putative Copper fist transcription factor [Rhizopus microsporus]